MKRAGDRNRRVRYDFMASGGTNSQARQRMILLQRCRKNAQRIDEWSHSDEKVNRDFPSHAKQSEETSWRLNTKVSHVDFPIPRQHELAVVSANHLAMNDDVSLDTRNSQRAVHADKSLSA